MNLISKTSKISFLLSLLLISVFTSASFVEAKTKNKKVESTEQTDPEVEENEEEEDGIEYARPLGSENTLSFELLGPGILYSVTYSKRFSSSSVLNIGASYFSLTSSSGGTVGTASIFTLPVYYSYLIGGESHFFEPLIGLDFAYISVNVTDGVFNGSASGIAVIPLFGVGYRYWPVDGGFHFRATLYGVVSSGGAALNPGLTFGFAF